MAISDNLRKYLQEPRTQELLNEDNLTMFLVESFSQLDYNEYIELVDILFDQYDNFFAEVTDLIPCMFSGSNRVAKVDLNADMTTIPSECFEDSNVMEIEGVGVTHVKTKAFFNCHKLKKVSFPNLVEIGSGAFNHCINLTNFDLPDTVTKIGVKAFANCPNLTFINYHGTKEQASKINFSVQWDGSFDSSKIKIKCTDGELN